MPNPLIPIPAGAPRSRCEGPHCAAFIYRVPHPATGRRHPVSVNVTVDAQCVAPTETTPGAGVSHFADCPDAALFRQRTHTNRSVR